MFAALSTAVDELDVAPHSEAIVTAIALRDRLAAKVCIGVGEFDRRGGWVDDHAVNLMSWLRVKACCSKPDATRLARTATRLQSMPMVSASWEAGRLSSGQVEAIVANVTTRTAELFAAVEADMVGLLEQFDINQTVVTMLQWRQAAENTLNPTDNEGDEGRLSVSTTYKGRVAVNGDLDIENGELLDTALRLADSGDPDTPAPVRRANALGDICRHFLDHNQREDLPESKPGRRRARPHLNFIVMPDGTAETEAGAPVLASVIERLACDARTNAVLFRDGQVLYYGKTRRTVPDHLFDAIVVRDRGCRFPGCDRPANWCDGHHVVPWDPKNGDGATDIDNVGLLCSRHHHLLHKPGSHAKLLPDGTFEATDPSGVVTTSKPPGDPGQRKLFST